MTTPIFVSLSLVCDFVSRLVTSPTTIQLPLAGDLMVRVSFTGQADSGLNGPISPTLADLTLALKEVDSGEILVVSDQWSLIAGSSPSQFLLHLSLTGNPLLDAILDAGTANLIAEIEWTMANPYTSVFGPATITTRSQDFPIAYTTV